MARSLEDAVARRRNVREQLLHQLVVVIGERLQHGEAGILLAIEIVALEVDHLRRRVLLVDKGPFEREIDEAGNDIALPDRDLAQQQRHPRRRLQNLQAFTDLLVGLVDLVEEQEARNFQIFQLAQDELELGHLALVRFAHHDGGVDRGQHRAHVVHEFDGAWTIDERVAVAHEGGGGDGKLHAHLVITGLLAGVADGGPGFDAALTLHRAGAGEDRLEQCRLAALERPDQRNAPRA